MFESETKVKRTIRLKNKLLTSPYELCTERAKFFTEIYKYHDKEPEFIKKAKAIAYTLKNMTIFIREYEMLV
ncbi:MAG: pyruvate formate lyase family protein, partial [Promethearchaeota archaeon]